MGVHLYSRIALPRAVGKVYAGAMQSAADASTNGSGTVSNASPDRLATVVEAAQILGITPDAVRSRLRRGTLERSPERGDEGEVLVVLPAHKESADQSVDQSRTVDDQSSDASGDQSATDRDASPTVADLLVERMASEIDHLRGELALERESSSELRRIIAAMTQRVPVVELEAPQDERNAPEAASEGPVKGNDRGGDQGPRRASWWRRFFGFE